MPLVITNLVGPIVGPVDLVVEAGTPAVITGPSGSGKSLFLRMVADLEPNTGDVRLGEPARDCVPAPDWRRHLIYVAPESGWWSEAAAAHIEADRHEAAKRLATRLGLATGDLSRPVRTLSTGERQRLSLVRAIVCQPKALLLDEPTSALDPESVTRVETILNELRDQGTILLVVSHDPTQAARLGATPYAMTAGTLVAA